MVRIALVSLLIALGSASRGVGGQDHPGSTTDLWRPQVRLWTALRTHDSKAISALLSPRFVFISGADRVAGAAAAAAMQSSFDRVPADVHYTLGTMPAEVVKGKATLARSATTPTFAGKATKFRWEDVWERSGSEWKLAEVRTLSNMTVTPPVPVPDNPAVRAELRTAYDTYFKALLTHNAALFRRVTLPTYTSILEPSTHSYKKTGDPLLDKMQSHKPLGDVVVVEFKKLFVHDNRAVAVVDQVATSHEKPDPMEPPEFRITSVTIPCHVKDTWVRTKEGWKLAKEESVQ